MITILVAILAVAVLVACGLAALTARTASRIEQAFPPRGKFMEIDGNNIHFTDNGKGPPIVMIHGLTGQLNHFAYVLDQRLTQKYRVVLIDRPGSGYSTRAAGASASLAAQAAIVMQVIRALGLKKPLLVGHSLGGALSLAAAVDYPDEIGALALIAPATHVANEPPPVFRTLTLRSNLARFLFAWTLAAPLAIRRSKPILDIIFGPDAVPRDFATKGGGLLSLRPSTYISGAQDLAALGDSLPLVTGRYSEIKMPVSMLFGQSDRVLDPALHGERLKDKIPQLAFESVPGGHMIPITIPETVAAYIDRAAQTLADAKATHRPAAE